MSKFLHLTIVMLSAIGLTALFVLVLPAQGGFLASPPIPKELKNLVVDSHKKKYNEDMLFLNELC
jgi:hypothetical protein